MILSKLAAKLVADGKLHLISGIASEVIGLHLDSGAPPSLPDLMRLARELEIDALKSGTPQRFLLGDIVSAIEALPGVTKRDRVNAAFDEFGPGQGDAYGRLRKYSHVARAYPADAPFADGSPRRRLDVSWSILQELAPAWVPDDLRQHMLQAAACGKMSVQAIRRRREPFRPLRVSRAKRGPAPDQTVQESGVVDKGPTEAPTPVVSSTSAPWEAEYARLVTVPDRIPGYHIPDQIRSLLTATDARAKVEQAVNLLLVGDSGHGKTSLARQFAAETGRRLFIFNCGAVRQESEWWGTREAADGRTYFRPSPLVYALMQGDVVILFDEINRIPAHLLNPLLPLLDDRRETVIPSGYHVRIAPGTILIGTANIGDGYIGTFQMDSALKDRLKSSVLTLAAPPPKVMQKALLERTGCAAWQAELLVSISVEVKDKKLPVKIGMRSLLDAARWMTAGMDVRQACEVSILNGVALKESACRATIENVLDGLIPPDLAAVKSLVNTVARIAVAS